MSYQRFEDVPVWQDAIELARRVFAMSGTGCLRGYAGFRDQLERAVVSISNNIAEGFERGSNGELLSFLYIARGSAGEVRSMLGLLEHIADPSDLAPVPDLKVRAEGVSRQIGRWAEYLKNSGYKGTKTQTDQSRQLAERARRSEAFQQHLREIQDRGASHRPPGKNGSGPSPEATHESD